MVHRHEQVPGDGWQLHPGRDRLRSFGDVTVTDVSGSTTAIGLWGPNARRVLERVTSADVGNDAFPYFTARTIDVGMAEALALRGA